MADVDPIVIEIKAEMAGLRRDMSKAKKELKDLGFEANTGAKKFLKFDTAIKGVTLSYGGLALAAGAAAAAIALNTHAVGEEIKELKVLSQRVGMNMKDLSKISAVAKGFGVTTEGVADAIKDLNVKIADANTGAKGYQDMLKNIGLKYKDLKNLDPTQQFYVFADAIQKTGGNLSRFGLDDINDAMFQLGPLVSKGSKEIKRLADEAERMGKSFSQKQIDTMEDYNKSIRGVGDSFGRLSKAVAEQTAPVLADLADIIADSVDGLAEVIQQSNKLMAALKETRVEAEASVKAFEEQKTIASAAAVSLSGLGDTTTEYTDAANSMNAALEQSGTLTEGGAKAIDHFGEKIKQGKLELESFAEEIRDISTNELFEQMMGGPNTGGAGDALSRALEEDDAKKTAMEERRKQDLNDLFEFELEQGEIKAEANRLEEEQHQAWLDRMFGADKRAQEQNVKLWEHGWKGKQMVASKYLGDISKLMNTNSRKQFEIGKAAAIAQVAIDTPKAAMSAYSAMAGIQVVGPALGGIAAAAAIATGVSQIQNIKSQSFGGGGGVGGGIGGGAGAAGAGGADAAQAEPANVVDATFVLQGEGGFSGDQIRGVAAGLNDFIEDGGEIRSVNVV